MTVRPKRILITGGSGYLGRHLVPLALERHPTCHTYYSQDRTGLPGSRQLDCRSAAAVFDLAAEWQPEVILHLAGSDRSPDMKSIICQGAENIVQAARNSGSRLIHLSSDVIFDGRQGPYQESDPPGPIHAYAEAKAAAEKIVSAYPNHVIVRTSLIYGLKIMDHATNWLISMLQAGKAVTLFTDQLRNPAWAETLARACLELIDLDYRGILHIAGRQAMSRVEFGEKMLDWWNIQERTTLSTGPSPDTWPKDCRLDISRASQLLTTPLPGLDDVLAMHNSS